MIIEAEAAEWAASFRFEDAPAAIRERVELIFLDAVASGVAGLRQQLVRDVEPVARRYAGDGLARTALLAGYAITSATACDVYRPGLCHVTPVTVPPLLALGAADRAEFLSALTVGLELTPRLLLALNYPALRGRGWHAPGVAGPVGAAAASARLLALNAGRTSNAMAFGALQAAGTFAALGTEAVKFNQARGAASALLAALAAQAGLSASTAWLTASDGGLASAYTEGAQPDALVDDLGERWELMRISLRRWPAASSVQSLLDVCLSRTIETRAIKAAHIALAPAAFQVSGERPWRTPLEAQQSARWAAAAALVDGDWWLEHSDPQARLGDADIDGLAQRITVDADDALPSAGVRVSIELTDGTRVDEERHHAPGDPELPLSRAQIEKKLRRAARSARLDGDEIVEAADTGAYVKLADLLSASPVKA
jgi:2-methylcitrate dehydratase PrpD